MTEDVNTAADAPAEPVAPAAAIDAESAPAKPRRRRSGADAEPVDLPLPATGGSYIRLADGSLERADDAAEQESLA